MVHNLNIIAAFLIPEDNKRPKRHSRYLLVAQSENIEQKTAHYHHHPLP
jgi:hypothetical protein